MSNETPKKKKKSGGSKAPIIFFILIIGAVAASNFVGPKKGWINELAGGKPADTEVDTKTDKKDTDETASLDKSNTPKTPDTADTKDGIPKTKPVAPPTKQLSDIEKKHAGFVDYYLTKANKYDPKKAYNITTPNKTYNAFVTKVDEAKYVIYIREKKYNAKSSIHYSMLPRDARKFFFREKAARSYADRELEKYLKEKNAIPIIPDEPEVAAKDPVSTTSKPVRKYSSKLKEYDVTVQESSSRLAHAALEVNNYLRNQVRLGKKKDGYEFAKVSDCHAKQHGSKAVFYLYVSGTFAKTSSEYKFQMIDGIRRFWALRAMSNGVAGASNSLLCVVYNGKVIGGSKISDAEDIFIR